MPGFSFNFSVVTTIFFLQIIQKLKKLFSLECKL